MKKIVTGCCCLGWLTGISQTSAIFKGGNGDGYSRNNYQQTSVNFWKGGSADGSANQGFAQNSVNFWKGGDGDGYTARNYAQNSISFWKGGDGDGYAARNYVQNTVSFWKGGDGDGYAEKGYTQASSNFWLGGKGDGWASVYKPQGSLPLTWLSFDAENWQGKWSRLTWKTASESNTDRFEIERGTDAVNFVKIATVKAAGNSATVKQYTMDDVAPVKGFNYYRIKQVDLNGRFSYSPARLVRFDANTNNIIRIYPNPATAYIDVEIPETMRRENAIINIIALNGTVVEHVQVAAGSNSLIRLNVAKLARAAYTVHLISESTTVAKQIVLH